ncbi:hypothetical protein [Brevundimonas sp.]|uniref:hypothetical protein n=1 Tax=Brevundimonas sp. TaxID=1871086 RepID=UPI001D8325B6|nr:hypothetical protein [Brevundimonas sp.]MBA4000161.1 hypothetical protein [Brevundimonas sp.]
MTLILTAVTPHMVLHLSDRLVTRDGWKIHDPMSNKTVVYRAKDGFLVIGYAGLAYQGVLPTDEWIAEQLWGAALPRHPDGRPVKSYGRAPARRDVGQVIQVLRKAIEGLTDSNVDLYRLEVTVAGWQAVGKNRARPVLASITRGGGRTELSQAERRWPCDKKFRIAAIGAPLTPDTLAQAVTPFRGREAPSLTALALEKVLADLIRTEAAKEKPTVGAHLLSVIVPRPDLGPPVCRFLPMSPHLAVLVGAGRTLTVPVTHTPWFLGPGIIWPPSVEVGLCYLDLGTYEVEIQGAPASGSLAGLSSSIRRTPPPQ